MVYVYLKYSLFNFKIVKCLFCGPSKKPSSCATDFSVIMISKKHIYDKIHDHRWKFLGGFGPALSNR
jgi:hypothetical protein